MDEEYQTNDRAAAGDAAIVFFASRHDRFWRLLSAKAILFKYAVAVQPRLDTARRLQQPAIETMPTESVTALA